MKVTIKATMKGLTAPSSGKKARHSTRIIPSREVREVNAMAALKHLSLDDIARLSGVEYTMCSAVKSGARTMPRAFAKIRRAVEKAPMP